MRRNEEDQAVIDRGKLWIEFQKTEWAKDLFSFLKIRMEDLRETVVAKTLAGEYEEAKADAQKLKGYEEILDYVRHDAIDKMNGLIAAEEAERHYKDQIPNHV